MRLGFRGSAAVETLQVNAVVRRILFVKGKPVASDSPYPVAFLRKDDIAIVPFDTEVRYEFLDAPLY
jgi:hypothetical protein